MNMQNFLSLDYQSPTAVVLEISSDGVLCQSSNLTSGFDGSSMENIDRDAYEW